MAASSAAENLFVGKNRNYSPPIQKMVSCKSHGHGSTKNNGLAIETLPICQALIFLLIYTPIWLWVKTPSLVNSQKAFQTRLQLCGQIPYPRRARSWSYPTSSSSQRSASKKSPVASSSLTWLEQSSIFTTGLSNLMSNPEAK